MPSTINNATFDIAAAAVAAPYGPLTRVGDVADRTYNSAVKQPCTSALSSTPVNISYDELQNADVAARIIREAHSAGHNRNADLRFLDVASQVIAANLREMTGPLYLDSEWEASLKAFTFLPQLWGMFPQHAFEEIDQSELVKITALTLTDTGALQGTLAGTITGRYHWMAIDWGDSTPIDAITAAGTISIAHTYAGAATYNVKLYVIGAGGVVERTASAAIA